MAQDQFHRAIFADHLSEGQAVGVVVNGTKVLIARLADSFHAVIDRCSHAESDLSSGRMRRGTITCPLHGARFELSTGKCLGGVYAAITTFPTRVCGPWVEVSVPAQGAGLPGADPHDAERS